MALLCAFYHMPPPIYWDLSEDELSALIRHRNRVIEAQNR